MGEEQQNVKHLYQIMPSWITAVSTLALAIFAIWATILAQCTNSNQSKAILQQYELTSREMAPVVYVDNIDIVSVQGDSLFKIKYDLINAGKSKAINIKSEIHFSIKNDSVELPDSLTQTASRDIELQEPIISSITNTNPAQQDVTIVNTDGNFESIIIPTNEKVSRVIYQGQSKTMMVGQAARIELYANTFKLLNYIHIKISYGNVYNDEEEVLTKVYLCYPHNLQFIEEGEY